MADLRNRIEAELDNIQEVLNTSSYMSESLNADDFLKVKIFYEIFYKVRKSLLPNTALKNYSQSNFPKVYRIPVRKKNMALYVRTFHASNQLLVVAFDTRDNVHERNNSGKHGQDFVGYMLKYSDKKIPNSGKKKPKSLSDFSSEGLTKLGDFDTVDRTSPLNLANIERGGSFGDPIQGFIAEILEIKSATALPIFSQTR